MLLVLGCLAFAVAGFVVGLMYAKRVKEVLSGKVDG